MWSSGMYYLSSILYAQRMTSSIFELAYFLQLYLYSGEEKFNYELMNYQETITFCKKSQLEANLQNLCLFTSVFLNRTLFGNIRSKI